MSNHDCVLNNFNFLAYREVISKLVIRFDCERKQMNTGYNFEEYNN